MLAPAAQQLYVPLPLTSTPNFVLNKPQPCRYISARARVFIVKPPPSPLEFPPLHRVLEASAKWHALLQVWGLGFGV